MAISGTFSSNGVVLPATVTDIISKFSGTAGSGKVLGADGSIVTVVPSGSTQLGSGTGFVMATALGTSGHCAQWGAVGLTDSGAACGGGGGSSAFNAITTGTNTTATMTVGTGGALTYSGSGVINANQMDGYAVTATAAGQVVLGGDALTSAGYIPYVASSGVLAIDSLPTLYIDATNHKVGFGSSSTSNTATAIFESPTAIQRSTQLLVYNGYNSGTRNCTITVPYDNGVSAIGCTIQGRLQIGSNQQTQLYGTAIFVGINPPSSTSGTVTMQDNTASTGATRINVLLGAADSATTATIINAGTTKSAGYQSSDGSAGITGATCSSFKNGLCVVL